MTQRYLIMSLVISAFFFNACDKKEEKPADTKPAVTKAAEPKAESKPAPKAPKLTKKKLSELGTFDYMDILKAAEWTNPVSGGMAMGAWDSKTITAKKGDKKAMVTIVKPSGQKEDPKASIKARSPKDLLKEHQEKGVAELLKEDYLLAVTIEGDPEGAKKLLAHIKEWIIVE
jgi:hypothetical protein